MSRCTYEKRVSLRILIFIPEPISEKKLKSPISDSGYFSVRDGATTTTYHPSKFIFSSSHNDVKPSD